MTRRVLPVRRQTTNLNFEHDGQNFIVSFGRFSDGKVAEIFLNTEMKHGSLLDVVVQDAALLVSLALQYGCPLDVMKDGVKRTASGRPQSPIGAALDIIVREEP